MRSGVSDPSQVTKMLRGIEQALGTQAAGYIVEATISTNRDGAPRAMSAEQVEDLTEVVNRVVEAIHAAVGTENGACSEITARANVKLTPDSGLEAREVGKLLEQIQQEFGGQDSVANRQIHRRRAMADGIPREMAADQVRRLADAVNQVNQAMRAATATG